MIKEKQCLKFHEEGEVRDIENVTSKMESFLFLSLLWFYFHLLLKKLYGETIVQMRFGRWSFWIYLSGFFFVVIEKLSEWPKMISIFIDLLIKFLMEWISKMSQQIMGLALYKSACKVEKLIEREWEKTWQINRQDNEMMRFIWIGERKI